jgi:hypothetical protein
MYASRFGTHAARSRARIHEDGTASPAGPPVPSSLGKLMASLAGWRPPIHPRRHGELPDPELHQDRADLARVLPFKLQPGAVRCQRERS